MSTKYIACVDQRDGHIVTLRVWAGSAWSTVARAAVVAEIEAGTRYCTWVKLGSGKYVEGSEVHVIRVNGGKYLRTDRNGIARDNLDSLPSVGACPF